ncbi:zinc finger BED domain-containing protein 5-like [Centroberyx affinis]|uniref:zinc finger BED domain-containing protein 5-like n=1 Tax=Centroberyx affinis TaxID=166261 RepID=UPI003A5BA6D6
MKPSRLKEHLTKIHPDKADRERPFFQALKEKHGRSTISSLFARKTSQNDSGLVASYNISLLIAKCGQLFTIGEKLVLPAIKEVISTVMERDPTQVLKSIPLSNDTVARRINEMAADTEEQLCAILRDSPFSLQLDETTTSDNNALLMAYEKSIPITNILACATDGAPSMVGRYRGFTALLKEQVLHVLTVHCVLHRHNLVAKSKSPPLHESLNVAVKAINKIKAHPLNDRLFRQLCQENDETFERLLLHTDVRWLSKGNCLARFCELFDSIVEFLEEVDAALGEKVSSSHCDIMYLADFFEKMNEVTLKLQGNGVTLVQCKAVIHSLTSRLDLYRQSIGRRQFAHFPQLTKVSEALTDDRLLIYIDHLRMVKADMEIRFRDLLNLDVPIWVVQPFQADVTECEPAIQEHLIDIQCDDEAQATFRTSGWGSMWVKYAQRYPALWEKSRLLLLAFPKTYLVEQGFSQVLHMQSKYRNRLDLMASGALRLKLTSLQPAVKKLAENHQAQGSH